MGDGVNFHLPWSQKEKFYRHQLNFESFMQASFTSLSKYIITGLLQKFFLIQVHELLQ